ncbi:hypothetical protein HOK51_04755 [Candidatus Woesearchaeota archaeon]|jgi:hypothetical protein|nr:hypothetical protein [Candidatus Woesearchaeota archaeon]MBT6519135.1 hypothetical protein [Candidatus Woesearchaeota archaeon]MBT7367768.1 hypothetical protein [Candidatus Woesearchaeota archaeon]
MRDEAVKSKLDSYRNYVSNAHEDELRIQLSEFSKGDFKIHSAEYIGDYFKQLGIEYDNHKDIDVLSSLIAKQLDPDRNSGIVDLVEERTGIDSEKLKEKPKLKKKKLEGDIEDLDSLLEPLRDAFIEVYELLSDRSGTSYFNTENYVNLDKCSRTVFYSVDQNKIYFGCSNDVDKNRWRDKKGFDVTVKKSEKIIGSGYKYKFAVRWFSKHADSSYKQIDYFFYITKSGDSIESFLTTVKKSFLDGDVHKSNYVNYIKGMFELPQFFSEVICNSTEKKAKTVESEITSLFSDIKKIRTSNASEK